MQKAEQLRNQILTLVSIIHEKDAQIQTAQWNNEQLHKKVNSLEEQVRRLQKDLEDVSW